MSAPLRLVSPPARQGAIVATSGAMRQVLAMVEQCVRTSIPVLLVGETGTGKEVIARAIHERVAAGGPLVDVNCGALPPQMVESLLFGHTKGAFTGSLGATGLVQAAHGGTLFLDELGSLPLEAQASLLRVLETGEVRRLGETGKQQVRFRLVSTVHEDILPRVHAKLFRSDLYHRVAGIVIRIAPLRARRDDIVSLAEHFARQLGRVLSAEAWGPLRAHAWPGNVRELRVVIERAALFDEAEPLTADAVAAAIEQSNWSAGGAAPRARVGRRATDRERAALLEVCAAAEWNGDRIAAALSIHRVTLFRRLRAAGISLKLRRVVDAE